MSYFDRVRDLLGFEILRRHAAAGEHISAFIDDELSVDEREQVAAQFALDPSVQQRVRNLRAVDTLVHQALEPPSVPNADACIQGSLSADVSGLPVAQPKPRVPTAVIASVGLIVTAGVAFVGLRRRGLV
ncbi:MAG: hypothetical protein HOC05_18555 [Gemmatimonadetes bacterium]|nr:hypothetical protein [Gemmatimonadota bacterium]